MISIHITSTLINAAHTHTHWIGFNLIFSPFVIHQLKAYKRRRVCCQAELTVHPKRSQQNYRHKQISSHSSWPLSPQQSQELEKVNVLSLHIPYLVKTKSLQAQSEVEVQKLKETSPTILDCRQTDVSPKLSSRTERWNLPHKAGSEWRGP